MSLSRAQATYEHAVQYAMFKQEEGRNADQISGNHRDHSSDRPIFWNLFVNPSNLNALSRYAHATHNCGSTAKRVAQIAHIRINSTKGCKLPLLPRTTDAAIVITEARICGAHT